MDLYVRIHGVNRREGVKCILFCLVIGLESHQQVFQRYHLSPTTKLGEIENTHESSRFGFLQPSSIFTFLSTYKRKTSLLTVMFP